MGRGTMNQLDPVRNNATSIPRRNARYATIMSLVYSSQPIWRGVKSSIPVVSRTGNVQRMHATKTEDRQFMPANISAPAHEYI